MGRFRIVITLEGTAPSMTRARLFLQSVKQLIKGVTVYMCDFKVVADSVVELNEKEKE